MDERFVHLRDKEGNLKASIGYLKPNDVGNVKYAILIISPSEPSENVSLQEARRKVRARLRSTPKQERRSESDWKPQKVGSAEFHFHSHGPRSAYEHIRLAGLKKIGVLYKDILRTRIGIAQQAISLLG